MRLMYYSTSYYANHGGSIQSMEFYHHLDAVPLIEKKYLFPSGVKKKGFKKDTGFSFRSILRKIPLLQVIFFYRRNTFYVRSLLKKVAEIEPDAILLQIDSNFLQIKTLKKHFPDLLICTQINGSPFDEPFKNIAFKNRFLQKQRNAYKLADLNFFISDFSRKRIMGNELDAERDVVIHNGTDVNKFFPVGNREALRQKWKYPSEKFILGYIGTLDFHKQIISLIEVFQELSEKDSSLILVIIGDGPAYHKISDKIKKLHLQDKVLVKGWIPHEFIDENLNCFDVAIIIMPE